ncbi:hypothetical protein BCR41DRAFT_316985 [Lobosporangium transversale]|uniref:Tetratricopeptide SHNi-TPR domain-containing protein n=1 Tax=Lobosporangium transversale TaxID=64571 RepID=A0A1Y2H300_9FUNG|nr:hypothetical protein BCR41DRAFT_316985 [Lobosporangium transversale]ORZ28394.1 hypothetical protein BCR41DRAFT_316985 [Lobosporangium transversale]|eukprot:XP_021886079.1 hypothetical protein BCR41DRAFT_316985 [Lobosporangium transversale]
MGDQSQDQDEIQQQQEQEQQEETPFFYDGPIDPATEQAIQELKDVGAKAFALQDYELAVEKFGLASEMLGQVYGETNPKCADTLFIYGKALLEHAIQQSSVLGGATEKKAKEEKAAVESGSSAAASSSSAPSNPRFVFEGDDDEEEEEEEEGGENEGEEGQDDFAVAWDVLDLARVLYHRQGTEEALLKLGDVHISLGDVSLESENFDQAVADFREAILIKEARLEPDDRQLAEAHYKLALALEYSPTESDKTQEHIHKAITVLKARIQKLNGLLASGKGKARATDENESESKMAKELIELHELIGEMDQKIQDLLNNQAKKSIEGQTPAEMLSMLSQQVQPVNDINNLIKPKPNKPAVSPGSSAIATTTTTTTTTTTSITTATITNAAVTATITESSPSSSSSTPMITKDPSTAISTAEDAEVESGLKRKAEDVIESSAKEDEAEKKIKV